MVAQKRRRSRTSVIRNALLGSGHFLLANLRCSANEPVAGTVSDEYHRVEIVLTPMTFKADLAGGLPGNHFSPLEKCIWDALLALKRKQPRRPAKALAIAHQAGQPLDTKFKNVLSNLVDRQVLIRRAGGYDPPATWIPAE